MLQAPYDRKSARLVKECNDIAAFFQFAKDTLNDVAVWGGDMAEAYYGIQTYVKNSIFMRYLHKVVRRNKIIIGSVALHLALLWLFGVPCQAPPKKTRLPGYLDP